MGKIIVQVNGKDRHEEDVESLAFFKNHLYSGAYNGIVKKWTTDLKLVKEWKAHDITVYAMATDGDKRLFTSGTDGEVKEWDADGNFVQMTILLDPVDDKPTEVKSLDWKSGFLFVGDMSGIVRKFRPDFVKEAEKLTYTEVWSLSASPNGETIFLARDNTIIASDIDVETIPGEQSITGRRPNETQPMPFFTEKFQRSEFKQTLDVRGSLEGRAPVLCSESHIICANRKGMAIRVYENDGRKYPLKCELQGHEMIINALTMKQDRIFSSGWDGKVKMWNHENEMDQADHNGQYIHALCINEDESENGEFVVYAGGKSGLLTKIKF